MNPTEIPPIVIDTNVWASRLITPGGLAGEAVRRALASYQPVHTEETLAELQTRIERPKLAKYTTGEEREQFVADVRAASALYHDVVGVKACADPDDDMFLGLAIASGARKLISSDGELLKMTPYHGIEILSPKLFLESERSLDAQLRAGTLQPAQARKPFAPYPWLGKVSG